MSYSSCAQIDIYMKLREDSLNSFQVIERTQFCDRQTDRQMPAGKTICLHTLKGGDIKKVFLIKLTKEISSMSHPIRINTAGKDFTTCYLELK